MAITIQIPPDIERELRRQTPDLDEAAREQFLIASYRAGRLSTEDITEILGLDTRHQAQVWLAQRGEPINYTVTDLQQDRENLAQLFERD